MCPNTCSDSPSLTRGSRTWQIDSRTEQLDESRSAAPRGSARPVVRGDGSVDYLRAPTRADRDRSRQRVLYDADNEHAAAASGSGREREAPAVPQSAGELHVHPVDAGGPLGGAIDTGHDRGQSGL